jgi:hypothetical protein
MTWRTPASMSSGKYSVGTPMRRPARSVDRAAVKSGVSMGADVESRGSWPAMRLSARAQSRTSRAKGPIWSRELAKATSPNRLTRP